MILYVPLVDRRIDMYDKVMKQPMITSGNVPYDRDAQEGDNYF
jgi:hypothetical protein